MSQLILQLVLGGVLIGITIAIQAATTGIAMSVRHIMVRHVARESLTRFTVLISVIAIWLTLGQGVGIWIWALSLLWLDAFEALEPSLYFALAAYTTLGFGDVLPAEDWRILGTLIGANGMIGFGLAAAALVNLVQSVQGDLPE
ncbi:MAG: ion channel [Pseudomonadota bacterium]